MRTPAPARPASRQRTDVCVVIGTPHTIHAAAAQIGLLGNAPRIVGYILPDGGQPIGAGIQLLGSLEALAAARDNLGVRIAIVSLPAAMTGTIARVRAELRALNIEERFLPPLSELLSRTPPYAVGIAAQHSSAATALHGIDPVALIGRAPRPIDRDAVSGLVKDRRILITGAGGSIGSEISRIVASFNPAQLLLMERSENALFEIDRTIAAAHSELPRRAILHDVVDADHTHRMLAQLRPHAVFHAAAHKHVPLMEDHPANAVTNNVLGTKAVADAAIAAGVERFVLVSTDKAVNPSSIMGATKRLAELYVLSLHARIRAGQLAHEACQPTAFSVVRFGNVLGSSCSVLQIWTAQLAEGGPLTVTDPRMTRYFMTIPEAASLVIQSATIAPADRPGVFVLDMGRPIRILDLAQRFAAAHGFDIEGRSSGGARPQIPVVFTGVRPGEKLEEELAYAVEELRPSGVPGVCAWTGPLPDPARIDSTLTDLTAALDSDDPARVIGALRAAVPSLRKSA